MDNPVDRMHLAERLSLSLSLCSITRLYIYTLQIGDGSFLARLPYFARQAPGRSAFKVSIHFSFFVDTFLFLSSYVFSMVMSTETKTKTKMKKKKKKRAIFYALLLANHLVLDHQLSYRRFQQDHEREDEGRKK